MTTRYEAIQKELSGLRLRQAVATVIPAVSLVALTAYKAGSIRNGPFFILVCLASLTAVSFLLHNIWRILFTAYRQWTDRASQIEDEIVLLQRRIAVVFDRYRPRCKGEHFKTAYKLAGKSVAELEEALAVGMFRERREIFVTAFMRTGVAVRVTASIGSPCYDLRDVLGEF